MKNLRVVNFPGAPVNVEVSENTSVGEAFRIAGIDTEGRELKLDGKVVSLSDEIGEGRMLVAMKKIKGNVRTIRVVNFPGAPINVEVSENTSVREAFRLAGIDTEGRELKLDGKVIDLNDEVGEGRMLVAMKKIKGNYGIEGLYAKEIEKGYAKTINEGYIPEGTITEVEEDNYVEITNENGDVCVVDYEDFMAIYNVIDKEDKVEDDIEPHQEEDYMEASVENVNETQIEEEPTKEVVEETETCECDCIKTRAEEKLQKLRESRELYMSYIRELDAKITVIEDILG